MLVLRFVGGIALLLMNGFFVVTEFALTRVRQFPQDEFDDGGLSRAWEMTEELEIYLSGCQVGITVASVALGVVAEPAVSHVVQPIVGLDGGSHAVAVVVSLALINILHVIVGEQIPTYLGVERTKTVARYCATPLYYWTKVMAPVIRIADRTAKIVLSLAGVEMTRAWTEEGEGGGEGEKSISSRAELRREMGGVLRGTDLSEERRREILNALRIGETPIREIATAPEEIVALSTENSLAENLTIMETHPHVRFPLVGEDLEDFEGIVYTPAILREIDKLRDGNLTLAEVAAPPMSVAADASVSSVIDQFQAQSQELALVFEDGEAVGLVTATDAFEAITGELEDPVET